MIKKLKPIHASVVIETRRPLGLFYVHENAVYVGIDNSAGHAWVEEFASLRQCKEWLRNPWMEAGPTACGKIMECRGLPNRRNCWLLPFGRG